MGKGRTRRDQVSIPQVAQAAGVSTATAGRALGGYGSVSQEARERVLAAAAELGYQRNDLARAIITGRSDTIGLVVADIENPFFAAAVRGVSDAARAGGYEVLLANTDEDPARERSAVDVLLAKRVDGLIVAPTAGSAEHLVHAQTLGVMRVQALGDPLLLDGIAHAATSLAISSSPRSSSRTSTISVLNASFSTPTAFHGSASPHMNTSKAP